MSWLVLWVVLTLEITGCPPAVPTPDEYGVVSPSYVTTTLACYETSVKPMQKEFATKEEALAFIEAGKAKYKDIPAQITGATARDWELKEITK